MVALNFVWNIFYKVDNSCNSEKSGDSCEYGDLRESGDAGESCDSIESCFLATLVALDFTLVSKWVGRSFKLA